MRFFVGVTDYDWFTYLKAQQADEVNFWQPSGSSQFRALQPGEPFLFKLHSPRNVIAGGGYFSHFSLSPLSFAWYAFQQNNGAHSLDEMRQRVWKYKKGAPQSRSDEIIGSILLQQPFFLSENDWIPIPDWPRSIVRGKGYDTVNEDGRRIWEQVQARLTKPIPVPDESVLVAEEKYSKPQIVLPRLGQGAFRMIVADSYLRKCALSSSHILHTFSTFWMLRTSDPSQLLAVRTLRQTAFFCAKTSIPFLIGDTSPSCPITGLSKQADKRGIQ